MPSPRRLVCPWCGHAGPPGDACVACGGGFDPETRRETQNDMGPWFVRDPRRPFQPGRSYEVLVRMIDAGEIGPTTILRGPTTRQLWAAARRVASIAHLLGYCHACDQKIPRGAERCPACRTRFGPWLERDRLGLAPVRVHPDEAPESDEGDDDGRALMVIDLPARGGGAPARGAVLAVAPGASATASGVLARGRVGAADEAQRLEALARRLAAGDEPRGGGSGAWTAGIAALLIVLAGLLLLPLMPGLLASMRDDGGASDVAADLPGGAFRSRDDATSASGSTDPPPATPVGEEPNAAAVPPSPAIPAPTAPPASPAAEPRGVTGDGDAPAAAPAGRRARPTDGPDDAVAGANAAITSGDAGARGADAASDGATAAATAASPAGGAAAADLRRLRRLAMDPAGDPAQRLRAWRMIERGLAAATARDAPVPDGLDAAAVQAGIDRVHLDAFLSGWAPADLLAAVAESESGTGIGRDAPADRRPLSSDAAVSGESSRPYRGAAADVRFFDRPADGRD